MKHLNRREFLKGAAAVGAGATLPVHVFAQERLPKAVGANDLLRIAVCGVKGRGLAHVGEWTKMKDVQVAAIVDIEREVPGNSADKIWQAPIQMACPKLISSMCQVWISPPVDASPAASAFAFLASMNHITIPPISNDHPIT